MSPLAGQLPISITTLTFGNLFRRILSCGILETPRFGRKSNFQFTPGAVVTFECNEGFYLNGDRRRVCMEDGKWDVPQSGYTECLRKLIARNPLLISHLQSCFLVECVLKHLPEMRKSSKKASKLPRNLLILLEMNIYLTIITRICFSFSLTSSPLSFTFSMYEISTHKKIISLTL